jgi:cytochrome oxidase Cu insertion factor (SCO1/SenC/PrrC family)
MNSGLNPASPILVSAFRSALLQQWLVIALIFILLLIAWGATRTALYGSMSGNSTAAVAARIWREPRARRLLRVGFGVIWLFDGILQAQPQMAGGLADQVMRPAASSSPGWVQHLVNFGVTVWDYHPVQAASASVWIQVGIGLWLIIAVRGWSARLAGLAAVAWGLVVWVFGEAFGGIFAPGLTILFGAPGAVLIYVVAGALVALPERAWDDPRRLGRLLLGGAGAFFLGMALLQAWPGRGFWQGTLNGQPGSLAAMIKNMEGTPQPHALESVVSWFGNFTAAHGFAVNLVAVLALALVGAGLSVAAVRGDARLARIAVIAGAAFCLADWVLIEDFGFLGGLGTDPNSMIPFILLFTAGYLGLAPATARAPATATAAAGGVPEVEVTDAGGPGPGAGAPAPGTDDEVEVPSGGSSGPSGGRPRAGRLPVLLRAFAGAPMAVVAAVGALGVILVGAAPMAVASVNRTADPIIAEALAGSSGQFDTPAPGFTLTSQDGRQVSLASLRGKVVLLTFLDPVCTTDCPLIAQEMRSADTLLGARAGNTELVAVVANPTYTSIAYTRAFTSQENLGQVPNWLYLTGSLSQLADVWHSYGIEVEDLPAGAMSAHNDLAFVISAKGEMRQELSDDPGPGTPATTSSFAGLMANSVLQTMSQSS